MLDGQPLVRDKDGIGFHPALPDFEEGTKCADFFAALGIELKGGMAENEMDSDAYEAMTGNGLTDDCDNYNAWTPKHPAGEGWNLVAVFDTEDGPACWWIRDMPFVQQRAEGYRERVDNAAVEVLSMNMKAKLAGQRAKGYRGWNNDCTQQRLSDLLRECVEKGDPVDVANFCAFLSARGEGIAPQAAPAAVAVPDERAAFEKWASFVGYSIKRWQADANLYEDNETENAWIAWQARAALAATPAAAPDMVSVKKVDANNYCRILAALRMEEEGDPVAEVQNLLAAAAEPAVLPEPVGWRHSRTLTLHETEQEVQLADGDSHAQPLFTEQQVRALLAGVSAPAAVAVEQAPVLYVSKGQLSNHRDPDGPDSANAGRYLPARITPAGNFTMPLFAAPQAQAGARDAESDYQRGYRHGYNRRDAEVQGALL